MAWLWIAAEVSAAGISYTYDSLNRLTKADYGAGVEISYTYDAAGNRLTYSDIDTTPYVDTTVTAWGGTIVPAGLNNVVALAAGEFHTLALRSDGSVTAWSYYNTPMTVPAGLSNVVAVAAGRNHSLALRIDGTVIAWGNNTYGQTNVPSYLSNVLAIACGGNHNLALRADGSVVAWGAGQTNNPTASDPHYGQAIVPAGLKNVSAMGGGAYHSLAVHADGTVAAWGRNDSGQTNVPAGLTNVIAVACGGDYFGSGSHNLALRANGTVVAWGANGSGQATVPAGLSNVVAVACGTVHSLAVRADGTVVAWGNNYAGIATVPAGLSNVVAVAGGDEHSLALSGNLAPFLKSSLVGQTALAGATATFRANVTATQPCFYQWQSGGTNISGATSSSLVLTNVTMGMAGNYSFIASNSLGTVNSSAALTVVPLYITNQPQSQHVIIGGSTSLSVGCESVLPLSYQWRLRGTNIPGATASTLILTNVNLSQEGGYTVLVSNSAGSVLSAKGALTVDLLAAWGSLVAGPIDVSVGLSNLVSLAGSRYRSLALRASGNVVEWGFGTYEIPAGLSNVVAVAAGEEHSLALKSDGTVIAWGLIVEAHPPELATVPTGLSNVVAIAARRGHSLALRADSTAVDWGYNPTYVSYGLSNAVAVACGDSHSLALRANGTVVAWGMQVPMPTGLTNVTAVACGNIHSLALRADGTVLAWGDNSNGQTNVPVWLSNVVAIAAGGSHSLALRADGTLVAWGWNQYGQTNVPISALPFGAIACGTYSSLALPALGPPFITTRLSNRYTPVGGTVFFRVEAMGEWPLHYQWQRNGVNVPGGTNQVLRLTGVSTNDAGNYSVIVTNTLGTATIPSASLTVKFGAIQSSLDNNLPWNADDSSSGWFAQATTTHDGVDAAQSGVIWHDQESWLESSVVGPGTLTYWWKVSSEPDYDYLDFYLDGILQPGSISGEVLWQKRTNTITSGTHALRWVYSKDVSDSFGQDAGWVDEVKFTTPSVTPQFSSGLSVSNGLFSLQLTGTPGDSVVIESSLNLTTWLPLQTNTLPIGGLNLSIPTGTNQQQFFRARIQ